MQPPQRYTITSALPYTNGPVHIGQLSGAYVPADIYVRYLRLRYGRENVVYVCGSDEHGVPITLTAQKEGVTPQDVVDKYHAIIKKSFEEFGIDFDIYHRTSDPLHHKTAQEFFMKLYDKGIFIEKESEQFYDEENNQFLADRYITGGCPHCDNEKAYGDQCEKCGSTLSPEELKNPTSAISGNKPIMKKTKHWYFPLDKCEDWLKEYILEGKLDGKLHHDPKNWKKHVLGQCQSWIDGKLLPRAMTRDLDWGIKVPVENAEGKVLYVWFDAPIGYISATKAWAKEKGIDWEPFWKDGANDEKTKLVHFIGKDNIVFHSIIFPAMLKEEGSFILPENVPANQFMNMEGEKMSTSRNWTVWLHEYLEEFPGKQDVLRYCLIQNMPENKDSDFSWKDFQDRNNNELVANIGNFVNRVLVLSHKYYDGIVQPCDFSKEEDKAVLSEISKAYESVSAKLEKYEFKSALQAVLSLSSVGNKYLADNEPWKLFKTDEVRTGQILNVALQVVQHLAVLTQPVLPFTADKIVKILGTSFDDFSWSDGSNLNYIPGGHQLNKPELLFDKIENDAIQKQLDKLAAAKSQNLAAAPVTDYAPIKSTIQFDDFVKLDIRTGTIVEAVKVPKSSKLLNLTIDLGLEKRTVLSGIAKHFTAEEVIGQQVCVLANLAPRKMMGTESNGMVLMAEDNDGKLKFLAPSEVTKNGMSIS